MFPYKPFVLTFSGVFFFLISFGQSVHPEKPVRPLFSAHDSILASRIPVLEIPENLRSRAIPAARDNTTLPYWTGIIDQHNYYTCQQFAGVAYVFGYEINRLRNQPGWYWEHRYPPHFTWNFLNYGEQYAGVNFFQSFDYIRQQGHITQPDFGVDTAYGTLGWVNGYDKYFRGMSNRLKNFYAIRVNSEEGILTLKTYLANHLDGSATGGIACFTTSGQALYEMKPLPAGTPEEGKEVLLSWVADPTHGLTIVGYNDSIRYDRNGDGLYTNNLDINEDGLINARDWEIGAFRFANSYGTWWSDKGLAYVLYSAMANNYGAGGVYNNSVYVVEADTAYHPMLTIKVCLAFNQRDKIRLLAGISTDTSLQMPEHWMDFPLFNFQGGSHPMQGYDSIPGADTLEFGLDITPLLSHVNTGSPARLFFMVEERDQEGSAQGRIKNVAFNFYGAHPETCFIPEQDVPVKRNDITVVSAILEPSFGKVQISTSQLPPFTQGQPYITQLQATNGHPPYHWSLMEPYEKNQSNATLPQISGQKLIPINYLQPYAKVALPFSFPFYGKKYDSLYVNFLGFVSPDQPYLPFPYVTDELSMLKQAKTISPAFSQAYEYFDEHGDGIWMESSSSEVVIRWKASLDGLDTSSVTNFGLRLFPDGRFEFLYGNLRHPWKKHAVYCGTSMGDEENYLLTPSWDFSELNQKAFVFNPVPLPGGAMMSEMGLLVISQLDSTRISDIQLKVTDANHISDTRTFQLSDGLLILSQLISGDDNQMVYGREAKMKVTLINQGSAAIRDLELKLRDISLKLDISDSTFLLPKLDPGQTLTFENVFVFQLKDPLPDKCAIPLLILARTSQFSKEKELNIIVAAPDILVSTPYISDGADQLLQPGEVADLLIPLRNGGSIPAENVSALLFCQDTSLKIISDTVVTFEKLAAMSEITVKYQLKASRFISPGSKIRLQFSFGNQEEINCEYSFELPVGKKPIAIVKLSSETSSADSMAVILDSLRIPYEVFTSLPVNLSDYSILFVLLGASNQGSHTITGEEGMALTEYLNNGGRIYMEGYTCWYYANNSPVQPMFKYTSARVPIYYYYSAAGLPQTLGDSLLFAYTNKLCYAIFSFQPLDQGFATLMDAAEPPHPLEIAYDGEVYKTIGTMLEFGALKDSIYPFQTTKLMQRYLDFFGLNTSGLYPYFHAGKTSICVQNPLAFIDDSYDGIISWHWEFPGGNPSVSDEKNPVVTYQDPGLYDVKLSVSNGNQTMDLLKEEYIRVNQCQGIDDPGTALKFKIYPNPARDKITIKMNRELSSVNLEIFEISGRIVMRRNFSNGLLSNNFDLDISSLKAGIYILHLQSNTGIGTGKLIVN